MLDEKRWVKLNRFPQSVSWISEVFTINDVFYVVGHRGISTLNNEVYKFPSDKRYLYSRTCRVGNNMLVVSDNFSQDDAESRLFDPISKQWSDVDIKTKRSNFAVVYYLNKVWIVGGFEYGDNNNPNSAMEIYDPVSNIMHLSPIKMTQERSLHCAVVYKKKLFVFGGQDKDGEPLNSVEMFSPETNKFVLMTPMKVARQIFTCCRVGNLVYVLGGSKYLGDHNGFKSVEIYDLDSDTWTDGVDFPDETIENLHACAVNNKL